MTKTRIFLYLMLISTFFGMSMDKNKKTKVTSEELKLYNLIMEYRKSEGLEVIPLSNALTIVAQTHCKDLANNKPDLDSDCNAHSWSDKGEWSSSCCYTYDHKQAECMWNKPKELTSYTGYGFEISVGSSDPKFDDYVMTADYALSAWQKSSGHNNVILNKSIWKDKKWNAIGIGVYKGFSTVWFGTKIDETGAPNK